VIDGLREAGLSDVPVVLGGIIPEADAAPLRSAGVARIFTPKDFAITDVLGQIVDAIEEARA
jgi:(2R)-ethylmalonyl-CoA mutase